MARKVQALVEIVDIFPTLAELTGGKIPSGRDGKSLEPVLKDPSKDFRPFALTQYARGSTMGYSLRTERWRYTEWIQSGTKRIVARELYDHRETQLPQRNFADDAEQAEWVLQLSKQLDAARKVEASNVYKKK